MSKLYFKGDIIFLYVRFFDKIGNAATTVIDPKVRILHSKNGDIYEDLPWSELTQLVNNEYYFNFHIPFDLDCGMFDVIYCGEVNGYTASVMETFHVIGKSENYMNAIKLYGYVDNILNQTPLSNVDVQIISNNNVYSTQSYTKENGYWESFLYPGEYVCSFKKNGFKDIDTNIQLGNEENEMQFNNISMESISAKISGNGICKISDSYVLKNGIPLNGLNVNTFNITNPTVICASDITNNEGVWTIYLDPGYYFVKVIGNSMNMDFDKTFRLKINDDLTNDIEDMDSNKANAQEDILSAGNGSQVYKDKITDGFGNPIIDVQINVLQNNIMIAQTYSDAAGNYELFLNPGKYNIDIYHPSFKDIPQFIITI